MSIQIIQNRLVNYACQNRQEEENALKEITQEIALLALARTGFFDKAEFHGGTALRVLYGYDFIWYVSRKTPVNYQLLGHALKQIGPWQQQKITIDKDWLLTQLQEKIQSVNWKNATSDVMRFLKVHEIPSLQLWHTDFFLSRLDKMREYLT